MNFNDLAEKHLLSMGINNISAEGIEKSMALNKITK